MNFWQTSQLVPPIVARLMAKSPAGILTDSQIALVSGLSNDEVFLMSHKTTWDGIDIPTMKRFLMGCGVDFCNRRQVGRVKQYLRSLSSTRRRTNWKYLRTSPEWKRRYEPLLLRYNQWLKSVVAKQQL